MVDQQFDAITKTLGVAGSRRSVLAAALAGPFGLISFGSHDQAQARKRKRKKCRPCKQRKQGKCKGKKPDGPCLVFLSSVLYQGNLGGLSGADAKCQALASAAGLLGTFKAWLSDATSSPASRFIPSTGPYRLVNATTVAVNWTDLTDGVLAVPINVTETGGGMGASSFAWSNTKINGTKDSDIAHCANWGTNADPILGRTGSVVKSGSDWTKSSVSSCDNYFHLYCFQQS